MYSLLNDLDGGSPETSEVEERGLDSDSETLQNGALSGEVVITGTKKAQAKKGSLATQKADEPAPSRASEDLDDEIDEIKFSGKKKAKGKKGSAADARASVDDESYPALESVLDGDPAEEGIVLTAKKKAKGKKGSTSRSNVAERVSDPILDGLENDDPSEDDVVITGKKKGKGGKGSAKKAVIEEPAPDSVYDMLEDGDDSYDEIVLSAKKVTGKKSVAKASELEDRAPDSVSPSLENGDHSGDEVVITGKKKGKGKKGTSFKALELEEPVPDPVADSLENGDHSGDEVVITGKKKGKGKKGTSFKTLELEESVPDPVADSWENADSGNEIAPTGKKKGKGKKGSARMTDYEEPTPDPVGESLANGDVSEDEMSFSGKKKGKGKKGAKSGRGKDAGYGDFDDYPIDLEDEPPGVSKPLEESDEMKKGKGKKGAKSDRGKFAGYGDLDDYPVDLEDEPPAEQSMLLEPTEAIVFSGKKKPKKGKKNNPAVDVENAREVDEGSSVTADIPGSAVEAVDSLEPSLTTAESLDASEAALEASGGKKRKGKKGKKNVRSAQEEEDLDAILAELGGPSVTKAASQIPVPEPETAAIELSPSEANAEASLSSLAVDADDEQSAAPAEPSEPVESAAAKKKKKKKEKEKEKKAATAEKSVEDEAAELPSAGKAELPKGKAVEKKVPKHLKAMQEQLQRLKEAEEKRKREEEEKLRKEEEERLRLEEIERQKDETKRRRKEREKEKLMQKKKEGKFLTGKRKEEAKRLAVIREQMLSHAGLPADGEGVAADDADSRTPRKPKYTNKKRRGPSAQHGAEQSSDVLSGGPEMDNGNSTKDEEEGMVEAVESMEAEEQTEDVVEEIEEEKSPEPDLEMQPEPEAEPEPEEEDDDWDAKSFEDVALPAIKSAFAEDEVDDVKPEVVPAAPKGTKRVVAAAPKRAPSPEKRSAAPARRQQAKAPVRKPAPPPPAQSEEEEDESEEETDSEEDEDDAAAAADARKLRLSKEKREARKADALTKRSADDLRSPICCILGHVDTGKTKLLDCIRRTNVQEGEAGGITQQIGATYFPMENIRERTKELKAGASMKVPGLLVIDTPGHESFTNLRARGSSLCDIAILVVDIMHGLEPQTIESLKLLQMRKTPFVVALNKVDRLYDWRSIANGPIRDSLKLQGKHVVQEFETRTHSIIGQFKEQGMNSELYYKNKEIRKVISIVPTSAISGEGIPDLLMLLIQLTQKMMEEKLMYVSEVQCTVLEVKMIEGLGTTIDVVLVNGVLHEGDQIVVCGMQGPIVTSIRTLLTPHPMKELRVKGAYEHHKELKAAQGIKISAQGLEHAIAGTQLYVVGPDDDVDDIKEEAMQDMKTVMSRVDKSGEGVCVQASTLGSLEALLEFLKSPAVKIPVSGISIGPVHKKDVMRASVMLERSRKEFATILAFDVKVTQEAKELADEVGVKIFTADIIYHLFDQFTNYISTVKEEKRKESADEAVFPCVLKILPECVFNKKDPIIVGVDIIDGIARVGTPICVPSRGFIEIGRIASMEVNHKVVDTAKKGQAVAMKIIGTNAEETQKMFGRHFEDDDELVSSISRRSIDLLKENYREDLTLEEWKLLRKLKVLFQIP